MKTLTTSKDCFGRHIIISELAVFPPYHWLIFSSIHPSLDAKNRVNVQLYMSYRRLPVLYLKSTSGFLQSVFKVKDTVSELLKRVPGRISRFCE
jgi:hypothetical protein